MTDPGKVVNQLTKLEPIGNNPWVDPGTVSLFHDPNWRSPRIDLRIKDYTQGERFLIPSGFTDNATWVAWNLPVGVVVTLSDHHRSRDPNKSVGNLEGLGASVDLVGNGSTQATDLRKSGMDDIVASWFWREVDLRMGAFEMFEHPNFTGARVTMFLSEWTPGEYHNLPGWHINDSMTSLRWKGLLDRQQVDLREHSDGTGNGFGNVKGWGGNKEVSNLGSIGFDDSASSWRWGPVLPVKEVIEPIVINSKGSDAKQVGDSTDYYNNTGLEQSITFAVKQTMSETLTVSTTETHVAGVKATWSTKAKVGVAGVDLEVGYSLELAYEYTNSKTRSAATTTSVEINVSHVIKAAPGGRTTARLIATVGKVPETVYTTKAIRWYNEPVTGSSRDDSPQGNGKHRREEMINVTVAGGLVSKTEVETKFTKA